MLEWFFHNKSRDVLHTILVSTRERYRSPTEIGPWLRIPDVLPRRAINLILHAQNGTFLSRKRIFLKRPHESYELKKSKAHFFDSFIFQKIYFTVVFHNELCKLSQRNDLIQLQI